MAKCDICETSSALYDMADLDSSYQTEGIRSLCRSCEKWANAELWKIRGENAATLKARLCVRAGKKRVPWWRRWLP